MCACVVMDMSCVPILWRLIVGDTSVKASFPLLSIVTFSVVFLLLTSLQLMCCSLIPCCVALLSHPTDEELAVESIPEGVPEETKAFLHGMWRDEFCPVAKLLLDRVKTHNSDLIPL